MSSEQLPEGAEAPSRRAVVREKALQVQAQQARERTIRVSVISTVVILVSAAVAFGVYRAIGDVAEQPVRYPTGLDADGMKVLSVVGLEPEDVVSLVEVEPEPAATALETGEGEEVEPEPAPEPVKSVVDIHIYVDYLSPGSGEFQRANARQLAGWIADGAVTVTYHPVVLLAASSNGTRYSLRAAAASACVASHSPERFYAFANDLLLNQPEVDSDGLSDVELAELAIAVGATKPKDVRACIEEQHFVVWAKEATARALEGPLPGSEKLALAGATMIVVNGQPYVGALDNPAEFSQFVLSVASDAYYAKGTPTPTPTPSPSATSTDG